MKLHNKIVYLLISVFVVYTLLFSSFIYYSISNYAFTDFYKRLEIRAVTAAKLKLDSDVPNAGVEKLRKEYLDVLPNQREYVVSVREIHQRRFHGIPQSLATDIIEENSGTYNNGTIFYSGIKFRSHLGEDYVVVASAENYFYTHHIAYLRNLLFSSLAFATILIVVISWLVWRTLTQPINGIIQDVEAIGSESLHRRLAIPVQNDLLRKLTLTFNTMLDRLETLFETQKNFISNASHELRTPLTSIIAEADVALTKERSVEEYQASLVSILNEADKLDKKTKALLFLAQTGYSGKAQKFVRIRMDQLLLDVRETLQTIDPSSKIKLDFSLLPENPMLLKVMGNEQLLHLALSNIISNGIKYSDNNVVNVAIGSSSRHITIVVIDSGIGIPQQELSSIYDPYFRASNTTNYEGYGIGLPLARNIINLHNGKLFVQSVEGKGTTVEITLPTLSASAQIQS